MTSLFNAVNAHSEYTTNGMPTHASSLSKCVDLFFIIGASRGKNITKEFISAYVENSDVAIRTLLWARDAREGAGERQIFKDIVKYLIANEQSIAERVLAKIPELGRWDDVLVYLHTPLQNQALDLIKTAIVEGNALIAKWLPRPTGKHKKQANTIRKSMGLTPKDYRQLLVRMSNTVEQKMCAKQWDDIDFNTVPSVAAARYQKAFTTNAEVKYSEYTKLLETGEAKINAGAVYPYDVLKSLKNGSAEVANAQWAALPNYMEGSDERIMPLIDVSGSMECPATTNGSVTCMDVAISLGLYLAERQTGKFNNQFITFSERPQLLKVAGSLSQRISQISSADWGMSTNLESVFTLILNAAQAGNVVEDEMPTKLIIFSDMQFNNAIRNRNQQHNAMSMIESMYADAGYKIPQVIFWNLNATSTATPVTQHQSGASLVSGFSPAILKALLGNEVLTPNTTMLNTIMIDRYAF